jgi:hypothetical protein
MSKEDNFEVLSVRISEAEKRNEQRFLAQQDAIATAMVAQEKAVLAAMAAAEKAVTKAETAVEKRFESVNEFRKTLSDQTSTFITRDRFESVLPRIDAVEKHLTEILSRGVGRNDTWVILVSITSSLIALGTLAVLIFKH